MADDPSEFSYTVEREPTLNTHGLEQRIRQSQSSDALEAVVHDLEDGLLDVEGLPDDFFRLFSLAFEDSDLFSKRGAWQIVFALTNERQRLNMIHLRSLKRSIIENFAEYPDRMFRHAVCDFVARSYQPYEAYEILEHVRNTTSTRDTLPGFDILSKHPEWDEEVSRNAKKIVGGEAH